MTNELKQIEAQAMKLSMDDRAALAHHLLESLDPQDEAEIEKLWLDEAERRGEELEKGNVPTYPADEVLREARSIIK